MKKKKAILALFTVAAMAALLLTGCADSRDTTSSATRADTRAAGSAQAETDANDITKGKTLIVYYSYSGTTKRVAQHLRDLTGGTLYELKLAQPYSGSDNDVSDRVFAERGEGTMLELTGTLPDVTDYDRILIGTPVWNDSMSNPVSSYLQQTDFSGTLVAPFWTYITNQGTTEKDFARQIPHGTVTDGLALRSANGMDDETLDSTLREWLRQLQLSDTE